VAIIQCVKTSPAMEIDYEILVSNKIGKCCKGSRSSGATFAAALQRLAANISNRYAPRLPARGSTPAASVRSTRGKTWRQNPLDAA
jgi:hypothetical protein